MTTMVLKDLNRPRMTLFLQVLIRRLGEGWGLKPALKVKWNLDTGRDEAFQQEAKI